MEKKKGFTLIELLAVIVILAVIALIATPMIIGIINDSKKKAVDNSANGILKAAEYYYTKSMLDDSIKVTGQENVFDKLEYQGEKPENGLVYITVDGDIALSFQYGDTCYKKDYFDGTLSKTEYNVDTCKVSPSNQALVGGKVVTLATNKEAGLYLDSDGIYRYKGGCTSYTTTSPYTCNGENPEVNNYVRITFEGIDYLYRIISIEKEGIKIQGVDTTDNQVFDKGGIVATTCTDELCPRYNNSNTYCQTLGGATNYLGCNIFTILTGEIENKYLESDDPKGTITQNSSLFDYLNDSVDAVGQVKALRTKAKKNATWNTGFVGINVSDSESYNYEALRSQEKGVEYISTIALITATDYASASLDESCQKKGLGNLNCKNSNWLYSAIFEWTLTPRSGYSRHVWHVSTSGNLYSGNSASASRLVRPVGYLPSETLFTGGTGTQADPYTLS